MGVHAFQDSAFLLTVEDFYGLLKPVHMRGIRHDVVRLLRVQASAAQHDNARGDVAANARTCEVRLEECGHDRMSLIKALQNVMECGLEQVEQCVEDCPATIKTGISEADAEVLKQELQDLGAVVSIQCNELQPTNCGGDEAEDGETAAQLERVAADLHAAGTIQEVKGTLRALVQEAEAYENETGEFDDYEPLQIVFKSVCHVVLPVLPDRVTVIRHVDLGDDPPIDTPLLWFDFDDCFVVEMTPAGRDLARTLGVEVIEPLSWTSVS